MAKASEAVAMPPPIKLNKRPTSFTPQTTLFESGHQSLGENSVCIRAAFSPCVRTRFCLRETTLRAVEKLCFVSGHDFSGP